MTATSDKNFDLAWTGERMIPHRSDPATELFHWQRYLYFRPWYADAKVVDAASGEGYGANYAATFAASVRGIDSAGDAIRHAAQKYESANFEIKDVCDADFSDADLVISFETIEHLTEPARLLDALKTCKGRIVISTPNRKYHSPDNHLQDRPLNEFHQIEWTPSEFSDLIISHFPTRQVRFLSQEARWPGLIREGLDDDAMYTIAVIGEGDLPTWQRLGIAIPTRNASLTRSAVLEFTKYYPGEIEFAIVANAPEATELDAMRNLQSEIPHIVHLIEEPTNLGFGRGANRGLEFLAQEAWFDAFAVSNDDVTPSIDFLPQMATAFLELDQRELKPGILGCVTNEINGTQKVDIGAYRNLQEMHDLAQNWSRQHHSAASQVSRVRGLFMLISPDCLSDIGGFDPRFGIGNFEDDDYCLRAANAGHSIWQVDGAFLHHIGSSTFRQLGVNYERSIERNLGLILAKWNVATYEALWSLGQDDSSPFIPLTAKSHSSGFEVAIEGQKVDLIHQASDIEFAAYVMQSLRTQHREARRAVIQALMAA